jgi:hypothetical protein
MFLVPAISNVQYVQYCEARLICILSIGREYFRFTPISPLLCVWCMACHPRYKCMDFHKIFIIYLPYWYNLF